MADVTLAVIKQLRNKTGVGMMDCKQALIESSGNVEKAEEILRKKGVAVAQKRANNETNNGRIEAFVDAGNRNGSLIEVACETDFAANTEDMKKFAQSIAKQVAISQTALTKPEKLLEAVNADSGQNGQTMLDGLISKIAEKVAITRITAVHTDEAGLINTYIHPGSQLGVIVDIKADKALPDDARTKVAEIAKDVCMHIAVMNPQSVDEKDLDAEVVKKEMEIAREQLKASGKPEQIIDKILVGKEKKFQQDYCLVHQKFIKNDKLSVAAHVAAAGKELGLELSIKGYKRFGIGR
ncbi:translation elongation factor Ts [Candidatus Babeliales bacterium]|nr:translation elongation factor Ts [Candidatus Babeliales bacterium]